MGLRHHGPNQNLTRCSTRALNEFEEDIAPGVEEPIGITQHNIIRFGTLMIESIRQLQIDVQSLSDQSFTTFSELQKKIRRPQRFERYHVYTIEKIGIQNNESRELFMSESV